MSGDANRHLTRYQHAAGWYRRSAGLFDELGDLHGKATSLDHLDDSNRAAGDHDAAQHTWQTALDILRQLDHPDAVEPQRKVVDHRPSSP